MNFAIFKSVVGIVGTSIAVVAVTSASIFVILANSIKAKTTEKSTTLADENNTLGIMESRIKSLESQVKDLTSKLAMQETVIAEKDKHIKMQTDQIQMMERIFQNRNPELENFMKLAAEKLEVLIAASNKGNECLQLMMKQFKTKKRV